MEKHGQKDTFCISIHPHIDDSKGSEADCCWSRLKVGLNEACFYSYKQRRRFLSGPSNDSCLSLTHQDNPNLCDRINLANRQY